MFSKKIYTTLYQGIPTKPVPEEPKKLIRKQFANVSPICDNCDTSFFNEFKICIEAKNERFNTATRIAFEEAANKAFSGDELCNAIQMRKTVRPSAIQISG